MAGQPGPGSNPILTIDCTALNLVDLAAPDLPSPLIHQQSQPFGVSANFALAGLFAQWIANNPSVQYTVRYFYESIGPGPDGTLATVGPKPLGGSTAQGSAQTSATVPAFTLPPGTYQLTTVVTFGGSPPMTAFAQGPMIEIFA